jgi:hypothetical protein
MLREIRGTQEAIAIAEAAAAQAQQNIEASPVNLNIVAIPPGHYLQADGSFQPLSPDALLRLEHTPLDEAPPKEKLQLDEPAPAAAPIERDDDHGVIVMRRRPPRRPSWG